MRIRKRSGSLPFSSLCPTIPPDFQLHKVPSPMDRVEPGREGADEEQPKEAKAKGSNGGGDPSSVAAKEEENTHLDLYQPQIQKCSNPSTTPLPLKLEANRDRPSSDLQLTIVRVKDGWICSDGVGGQGEEQKNIKYESCCMCPNTPFQGNKGLQGEEETTGKRWRVLFNNSWNASSLGETGNGDEIGANGLLSSSSNHEVGRWCEGEKAFPLKKRRGSFDRKAIEETMMVDGEKKMRTILKTKTNKRCFHPQDDDDDDDKQESGGRSNINSVKKRGRSGVVMEGSRCSRMNGRGWRCCQPTLVGYSLCEYHLGKGSLRSMNTVRTCASSINISEPNKPINWSLSSSSSSSLNKHEDEEGKPLMVSTKKRKKIGMVKARSIRSLLGTSSVVNGNNSGIV